MMQQPTVLFDLDDSLHEAEGHLFDRGWNHVLHPWYFLWRAKGEPGEENLIPMTESQRPGIGVQPIQVARHFIRVLGLTLDRIDKEILEESNFKYREDLLELKQIAPYLTEEELAEKLAEIMEKERIAYFIQRISSEGVVPLPGYEVIPKLHEEGIKVGIVTNASLQIATAVLENLGFIEYEENSGARRIKSKVIDVIVSGGMPESPKPTTAPLIMADWMMRWRQLTPDEREEIKERLNHEFPEIASSRNGTGEHYLNDDTKTAVRNYLHGELSPNGKSVAFFGDSRSDVHAGVAYGILVIVRRSQYSDENTLRRLGATMIVDSFSEITPEMLLGEQFAGRQSLEKPQQPNRLER